MMEGRMADSKMPSDEVELLTDEFKRVKEIQVDSKLRNRRLTLSLLLMT